MEGFTQYEPRRARLPTTRIDDEREGASMLYSVGHDGASEGRPSAPDARRRRYRSGAARRLRLPDVLRARGERPLPVARPALPRGTVQFTAAATPHPARPPSSWRSSIPEKALEVHRAPPRHHGLVGADALRAAPGTAGRGQAEVRRLEPQDRDPRGRAYPVPIKKAMIDWWGRRSSSTTPAPRAAAR